MRPTALTRGVQLSSIAALIGWRYSPGGAYRRRSGSRGCGRRAKFAVNPVAVIFQRNFGAVHVARILLVFLIGWWHRDRRWGRDDLGTSALFWADHATGFLFALSVLV